MGCYILNPHQFPVSWICGDLGDHCPNCGTASDILCDYPVGDGKTCDAKMCQYCAHNIAPEIDYCHTHFDEWWKFKDAGGVEKELQNVVPWRSRK